MAKKSIKSTEPESTEEVKYYDFVYLFKIVRYKKELKDLTWDSECRIFKTTEDEINQLILKLSMDITCDAKPVLKKEGGVLEENPVTNVDKMYKTVAISYLCNNLVPDKIIFCKYDTNTDFDIYNNKEAEEKRLKETLTKEFGSASSFMQKNLFKFLSDR